MIGLAFIGSLLAKIPFKAWLAIAAVVALSASFYYYGSQQYSAGFSKANANWKVLVAEEHARQLEVNRVALTQADKTIQGLKAQKEKDDALVASLKAKAAALPGAGDPALGAGSVRLLNQLK